MKVIMESFVRVLGDLLFSTHHVYETKDIFDKCKSEDIGRVTSCVIKAMMCENTGTHYLDSGGSSGRAWQRNKSIKDQDWEEILPDFELHFTSMDDWYITRSMYKFLTEYLTYDAELDKVFLEFSFSGDHKSVGWLECIDDWLESIDAEFYGRGGNSYNYDNTLDGVIQYRFFMLGDTDYIIVQTHNGCDVRGGYSIPHVFSYSDDMDMFIIEMSDLCLRCNCGYINHMSDDSGYHWYYEGTCPSPKTSRLDEMEYDEDDNCFICPECHKQVDIFG